MSEENVELARRGYAAMLAGDLEVIESLLDPDVTWHGGDPGDPGACHSRQEAMAFMRRARAGGGMGELLDVIDAGDRVVVVMRPPLERGDAATVIANLSTFRDGKVTEMVHYSNPDDAIAAARADRADRA